MNHITPDGLVAAANYLRFEDLLPVFEAAGRRSLLCVIAPLRLPGGTGSPVNPIAIQ